MNASCLDRSWSRVVKVGDRILAPEGAVRSVGCIHVGLEMRCSYVWEPRYVCCDGRYIDAGIRITCLFPPLLAHGVLENETTFLSN